MANDINLIIAENPIKNGTLLTQCNPTGKYRVYDQYVKNTPIISDIQDKYDERFDDPAYYYGLGNETVVGG